MLVRLIMTNIKYLYPEQDIDECMTRYGNYSRGTNCYQTNHMGAYHRHFQVKPQIKVDGGLVSGKDVGIHDSDYFLEVSATNKALLSTVLTKRVCRYVIQSTSWSGN